ncbi:MAG TPA: hypothetical protein VF761_12460 [Gemmatimonadaceae bacterium]
MSRRLISLAVALTATAACTDLPSDPNAAFSVELRPAGSPSVVLGDELRDSLGVAAPLQAIAFNVKGDTIRGAKVRYRLVRNKADTLPPPATIDSVSGRVVASSTPTDATRSFRVYAEVGGLQSVPETLYVTRRPDRLVAVDSVVTQRLSFLPPDSLPITPAVSARLLHNTDGVAGDTVVPHYEVRFRIVSPASAVTDTSYVMLTAGDRRRSTVDTTDANGLAARQLRVRRSRFDLKKPVAPGDSLVRDTVKIEARAYYRNGLVAGSPVSLLVILTARPL